MIYLLNFFSFIICFTNVLSANVLDQNGEVLAINIITRTNRRSRSDTHSISFSVDGKDYSFNFVKKDRNIFSNDALFWNDIDETYAKIVHPKVEISLAGVVIANNEKLLDFIYNSTSFLNDGRTYINVTRYATNAANYFYRDFSEDLQFDNYHAAAVMTKMQLKDNAVTSGGEILGYANSIGNICRRGLNGAVGTDDGMFFGVDTFTHELGHLLNMMHDDTDHSFNKRDPTLENHKNEWVSQAVMAWDYGLPLHWTNCSIQSLTRLASYKAGQCLGRR